MTVTDVPAPLAAPPPSLGTDGDLADVIGELARARAFLAAYRPPVTLHYPATIGKTCTSVAEVDQIAAQIGTRAEWIDGGSQYTTVKVFGANVCYRATYIVRESTVAA